MPPDNSRMRGKSPTTVEKSPPQKKDDTLFTANRFQVYSAINKSDSSATLSESSMLDNSGSQHSDSINAAVMLKQLQDLQQQLRKGEEERQQLAKKLAEQQNQSSETSRREEPAVKSTHSVSRPFMPDDVDQSDLSQYSLTDKSADTSHAQNSQSERGLSFDSPDARRIPERMSPIGHSSRVEPKRSLANERPLKDAFSSEYSFSLAGSSKGQRSTSTPGKKAYILLIAVTLNLLLIFNMK